MARRRIALCPPRNAVPAGGRCAEPEEAEREMTWRPCLDGFYEISDSGELRRLVAAPGARVGKVLRRQVGTTGYPGHVISINGKVRNVQLHQLVAEAFLGPCPDGHLV